MSELIVRTDTAENPNYVTLAKTLLYLPLNGTLSDASGIYQLQPVGDTPIVFGAGKYTKSIALNSDRELTSAMLDNMVMSCMASPHGTLISMWLARNHPGNVWMLKNASGIVLGIRASERAHVIVNNREVITSTMPLDRRTWAHVALLIRGEVITLFIDGLHAGSSTTRIDQGSTEASFHLGGCGYLCELRILRNCSSVDAMNLAKMATLEQYPTMASIGFRADATGSLIHNNRPATTCSAWVNMDLGMIPVINGCFNVSSVTRTAVGDVTVHFESPMPFDNTYSVSLATPSGYHATVYRPPSVYRPEMSSLAVRIRVVDEEGVPADCANCCVTIVA